MAEWRARGRRVSGGSRPSSPREPRDGRGTWVITRGGRYSASSRSRSSASPDWPAHRAEDRRHLDEFAVRSTNVRLRRDDNGGNLHRPGDTARWPSGNPRRTVEGLGPRDSDDESVSRRASGAEGRRAESERFSRSTDKARGAGSVRSPVRQRLRLSDDSYGRADGDRMQVRRSVGASRRGSSSPRRRPDGGSSPLRRADSIGSLDGDRPSYAADSPYGRSRPRMEDRLARQPDSRHVWPEHDRPVRNDERFRERPRRTDENELRVESPPRSSQSLHQQTRERRVDSCSDGSLVGDSWSTRENAQRVRPKLIRIDSPQASGEHRPRRMDPGTGAGHSYHAEGRGRISSSDGFQPSYIPEKKKMRLESTSLSPHRPDEYIAVERRLTTDSKVGLRSNRERRVPFDKEWRSPKRDVDVFRDRSVERSADDAKHRYSRQSPRGDSRHTAKTGVRTDRFDRGIVHSLPAVPVQQAPMRQLVGSHGRHRSISPPTAIVQRSPRSGNNDYKIVRDVYADAGNVPNVDFDTSERAARIADRDDTSAARSSVGDRRASDGIKRMGRNPGDAGSASPLTKRRVGIDLREEVLGGRRYRGIEPAVVRGVSSRSASGHAGNYPVPSSPLASRAVRPELPGFSRPALKRSRSSSVGRVATRRTTPVASPEALESPRASSTRQKIVIEKMLSEEDRIRSLTRNLRQADFVSNREIDRSIEQLWVGFCHRMLDAEAVPRKHLKLQYLDAYFDVLKGAYPHFPEYYRVTKEKILVSSDSYLPEKRTVHSLDTHRARHMPPTSKSFEHGRAAVLLKRAKEQKLAVYRSSASGKTAEEPTFSGTAHRDLRPARQHGSTFASRRPFGSSASMNRQGSVRTVTGHVVRLAAGRGKDGGNGEASATKNPSIRPSSKMPPDMQDVSATSEPCDSNRTTPIAGSSASLAGSKSARPAVQASVQISDDGSERLQGTSLVAVADAAAATSGKAVFDDPFMKFLHTTLTAMIVIGELQRQQISGRLTANHSKSLADERAKMEERMRTDMGHRLIKLARLIQNGDLDSARETLNISENVLNTVANLDPVVIRTIALTPLLP